MTPGNGALALLLASVTACGHPRDIVVEEHDEELLESTLDAVDMIESWVGCTLFDEISVGGSRDVWSGKYAPRGVVTVEVRPGSVGGEGIEGRAYRGRLPRGRIVLRWTGYQPRLVAHELIHMFHIGHSDGLMGADTIGQIEDTPESVRRRLQDECIGPLGEPRNPGKWRQL